MRISLKYTKDNVEDVLQDWFERAVAAYSLNNWIGKDTESPVRDLALAVWMGRHKDAAPLIDAYLEAMKVDTTGELWRKRCEELQERLDLANDRIAYLMDQGWGITPENGPGV